jgi:hypothetical protein
MRHLTASFFLFVSTLIATPLCVSQNTPSAGAVRASNRQRNALPDAPSGNASPTVAVPATRGYEFPTLRQQFQNYLRNTFGPPAFIAAAVGAGIDQQKPAPPEWDSGGLGFSERYGFRYGMVLIRNTTKYSLGAAMRQDVAYHRCECTGFVPRGFHAIASTVTARTRSGRTIVSLPALSAPYAGAFAAMNAWYPARYESQDAVRMGSMSFTFAAGANLFREFLLRAH